MLVDLARGAFCVVGLWVTFGHFEIGAWHHDVGGVGGAGPLLTVYAVAESRRSRIACDVIRCRSNGWM